MSLLLIKNGILITQNPFRDIIRKNLTIENGRIIAIDTRQTLDGLIIDAQGSFIQPGFVQPHVHLSLPDFKKSDKIKSSIDLLRVFSGLSENIIKETSRRNIRSLISHGTTTILAMEHPLFTTEVIQEVQKSGLRAVIGNGLLDHGEQYPDLQKTMEENMSQTRELLARCQSIENHRIQYAVCPWSIPECSGQLWREIAIFANDNKLLVHTHACETKGELRAVKHGRSSEPLKYLDQFELADQNLILAHCVHVSEEEITIFQKGKVNIVHCPNSNEYFDTGTAPVIEMLRRKMNVSLGSDGTFCNGDLDMLNEMRKMVSLHGEDQLDLQTIFDMATIHGARALGMENEIGSIEVGKKADMVILDLPENTKNPIPTIILEGSKESINRVIVDGETIFKRYRQTK